MHFKLVQYCRIRLSAGGRVSFVFHLLLSLRAQSESVVTLLVFSFYFESLFTSSSFELVFFSWWCRIPIRWLHQRKKKKQSDIKKEINSKFQWEYETNVRADPIHRRKFNFKLLIYLGSPMWNLIVCPSDVRLGERWFNKIVMQSLSI